MSEEKVKDRKNRMTRMKEIALKLFQQLKGEKVDFEDAELVIYLLQRLIEREKKIRLL